MGQEFYKKIYRPKEFYVALYKGFKTFKYIKKCRQDNTLSKKFIERIMLAVTEVNGCEVCSYAHTKMALEEGMDKEEIANILSGNMEDIKADEAVAIIFAQHYADNRGMPSKDAWLRVVDEYGKEKALGILGAIRIIMIGNIIGIPYSAFLSRLKGKAVKKSSLGYELGMILSIIIFLPIAFVQSSIFSRIKKSD